MKLKSFFFLAAVLGCAALRAQTLTVGSYNVRNDNRGDSLAGNGWVLRCPAVCGLVRFHGLEVFGAQEVLHAQLGDMLAGLPGYDYLGVGRNDGKTRGEYAPIFYLRGRFEALDSGTFWLAPQTDRPGKGWDAALPRICTWARFRERESGLVFWFFNLHLDHKGVEARRQSAKLVLEKIDWMCNGEPAVLTGDFNFDQSDASYAQLSRTGLLADAYAVAGLVYAPNGTFNGFDPTRYSDQRIDHIFITRHFTAERYGVLTDAYWSSHDEQPMVERLPSDHYPVKVVLGFAAPGR